MATQLSWLPRRHLCKPLNGTLNPGGMVQRDQRAFAMRVGGNPTATRVWAACLFRSRYSLMRSQASCRQDRMAKHRTNSASGPTGVTMPAISGPIPSLICSTRVMRTVAACTRSRDTAPTPFGDAADVISSDVAPWVLRRYQLVIVSSSLEFGPLEVKTKIEAHLRVAVTSSSLASSLQRCLMVCWDVCKCMRYRDTSGSCGR